jgi:proteasome lid subunit RPN8/RPN11
VLAIEAAVWDALRRHGEEAYPHESCGALVGRSDGGGRVATAAIRCTNTRTDALANRYAIDPREILRVEREARARGEEIVAFYHSHPDHPARPSATDLADAHWFGLSYVITSVAGGHADRTAAFALAGSEDDKRFDDEEVRVVARGAA